MDIVEEILLRTVDRKSFIDTYIKGVKADLAGKNVILYGAHTRGTILSDIFNKYEIDIKYICDDNVNSHGKIINGAEIVSFEMIRKIFGKNACVVVSCYGYNAIREKMDMEGYSDIYYYPELLVDIIEPAYLRKHGFEINALYNMVADEKSRRVLSNMFIHMLNGNVEILKSSMDEIQYFDEAIIKPDICEVFVDCGAYIGDTIEDFITFYNNRFKHIYAFEADSKNIEQLRNNKECADERIIIINKGVFNTNDRLSFSSNRDMSLISEDGDGFIDVITLDSYFLDNMVTPPPSGRNIPTFIKMDIEGAEMEALEGCQRIIRKYAPKLAICVYHKFEDLWNIPFYIKKLNPDYRIYLRHYTDTQREIVCYAVM